jgi:hypothetical protein
MNAIRRGLRSGEIARSAIAAVSGAWKAGAGRVWGWVRPGAGASRKMPPGDGSGDPLAQRDSGSACRPAVSCRRHAVSAVI